VRVPAAAPAAAVLLGASLGALIELSSVVPALALMAIALAAAAAAFASHRPRIFLAAIAAVFFSAAWAVSIRATADARRPPLRTALAEATGPGSAPVTLVGRLVEDAAVAERGVALSLHVTSAALAGRTSSAAGGVRLTVAGTSGLDAISQWRAGRTVSVPALLRDPGRYRDPGVSDARLGLARKGVAFVGTVKSGTLVDVLARGTWVAEAGAALRAHTRAAVGRHVGSRDPQSAAIVTAILIGDRAGLDQDVQRRLQEAGTYHVIAISGGNIAILAGLLLWGLRMAGAGHRASSVVTIGALIGYATVVGGGASVVRATAMAVSYLLARQADLRGAPLNALAVACALILLATPDSVADVAFWLTFGATLGIMIGVGLAGARLPRAWWLRVPGSLLLTSLSAELALLPVGALVFSRVTFAGLVLNFAAIPLMTVVQVAGMLVVALSPVWSLAADLCGLAAHLGAAGLVGSASLVDLLPWLSYRLPPPHWMAMAGYYAGWAVWLGTGPLGAASRVAVRSRRRLRVAGAVGVVTCGAWILIEPVTLVAPAVAARLRVTTLDVGHGDAILVQLPDRRSVLVDTGGSLTGSTFDIGGRIVAPALWALGTRRLDVLVLTHGDPDHAGGAAAVIRDFRPREIWEGIPVPNLPTMQALRQRADAAGIPWRRRLAGDVVRLGNVTLRIHHPPPADWERRRVRNDDSMVIELEYGRVSVVLAGDIGAEVERGIAPRFAAADLRVLKIPHHGSSTSSSREFVSALRPRVAILTAGTSTKVNDDVLRRYGEIGATVYRTDVHGAVTVDTDGRVLTVSTFTGTHAVFTK
jgi:competence protein ComEC